MRGPPDAETLLTHVSALLRTALEKALAESYAAGAEDMRRSILQAVGAPTPPQPTPRAARATPKAHAPKAQIGVWADAVALLLTPDGMTAKDIMEMCAITYAHAVATCNFLAAQGRAQWVDNGQANRGKVLLPIGVPAPTPVERATGPEATARVLAYMQAIADKDGMVQRSQQQIAAGAKISPNAINSVLYKLTLDGRVMLARPGRNKQPSIYQLLEARA